MLNMGFIDQVESIIEELPTDRVTLTFSATLPEDVEALCHKYMKAPVHIEIKAKGITTEKIDHSLIQAREEDKLALLKDVTTVENPDSCIIFAERRKM